MSKDWTLSIDFGTSNTAAAHTNPTRGGVEAVNLAHDRRTMPSSVYIEGPDVVSTGDAALNKAESASGGMFIPSPKRVIPGAIQVNGYEIPASTPVAAVLKTVVERASREHNDERPTELVLTHPEAWSDNEIKVLLDAASQLGLNATTITTLSEPKAAAKYYSTNEPLQPGDKIAVFDFGGGTLDVAVLEAQPDASFNIVAARGDDAIGGRSFDALIRHWLNEQLEDDHPEVLDYLKTKATREELHALEDKIRRAKEFLSDEPSASITVPTAGQPIQLQITRTEFEDLVRPKLRTIIETTRNTLNDAGITGPEGLKALYLTGGSSRVPIVQEELKQLGPVTTLDDPKLVVAQGAISAATPVVTGLRIDDGTQAALGNRASRSGATFGSSRNTDTLQTETAAFPTQHQVNSATASDAAKPAKKSKKGPWIAAAAVAAVVAIGAGGFFIFGQNSDDSATTAQEETVSPTASGEADAQPTTDAGDSSDSGERAETTAEGVYNALPAEIQEATSGCNSSSVPAGMASFSISCDMIMDGDTVEYFKDLGPYSKPKIKFSVNTDEALRERALIKRGSYKNGSDAEPVSSSDDAALAIASEDSLSNIELHYANKETGLIIQSNDFASTDAGLDWLRTYNLL